MSNGFCRKERKGRKEMEQREFKCRNSLSPLEINDHWRICFVWSGSNAENVEIVDYHPYQWDGSDIYDERI